MDNIIQSFIFTLTRSQLSACEQRIVIKLVDSVQFLVKEVNLKAGETVKFRDENLKVSFQARDVLPDNNKHYEDIRPALLSLMSRKLEFYDKEVKSWWASPIIFNASYKEGSGVITFYIARELLYVLFDFTRGFSRYSLSACLNLSSASSMRFYMMFASSKNPINYSIKTLRQIFGCEDKYKNGGDFYIKVIKKAEDELKEANLNGFHAEKMYQGKKIIGYKFIPIKREQTNVASLPLNVLTEKELRQFLMSHFGFTSRELNSNKETLAKFQTMANWFEKLVQIEHRFLKGDKKKGYVINAIKSECNI